MILSLLTSAMLLLAALVCLVVGLAQLFQPATPNSLTTQSFLLAAGLGMCGALLLPSAWYATRRLFGWGKSSKTGLLSKVSLANGRSWATITIVCFILLALALLLGSFVSRNDRLGWLLAPLHMLAIGIPVLWLVLLGLRGLPHHSFQRSWGLFASGLVIGPSLILVIELSVFVVAIILWAVWVTSQPTLAAEITELAERLQYAPPNEETILRILGPYLMRPGTWLAALLMVAGIVPLIEEIFKPIGLWFLAKRGLTPAEGFAGGVLSGAGFALFENLGNASMGGEGWSALVTVRIATALLHMLTTGLTGWALVSAWNERRYLRLGLTYGLAITLHGLWNGMAILSVGAMQLPEPLVLPDAFRTLGSVAIVGLVFMVLANGAAYLGFNRYLRRGLPAPQPASTIEPAALDEAAALPEPVAEAVETPIQSELPTLLADNDTNQSEDSR